MTFPLWLALVGSGFVISLTPGAGAIFAMSNAIAHGWRRSIWGILGQQVALLVHILVVAAGVGALVAGSPVLFAVIRYVGAAYLIYLGVRQILAKPVEPASDDLEMLAPPQSAWTMFRRGVLVNLTNPKAIVFFLAFVPQFIRPDLPLVEQYTVLVLTVFAIDIAVMWFVFAAAARAIARLTRSVKGQRVLSRVFGGLFIGVGVLLAAVH
ncbi:LysE family transporter [Microbacterium stercoris]|uniref:LysE family transporter n=1 Tax=Microbacterium stercoris TaxID=2820289 RepID=A0A939QKW5_9MICO|nr:LysE family transporter [Microbacterium stercoris]MBO3664774.1 LysE family transporter [Microbacterium stercoris]